MMNNNNNANNNRKAKKRRVRHDLPGPAGSYFRRRRPQKMPPTKEEVADDDDGRSSTTRRHRSRSLAIVTSSSSPTSMSKNNDPDSSSPAHESSSERRSSRSRQRQQQQQRQRQAFHDHTSDLHECNAWNMMCVTLDRIVPRPEYDDTATSTTTLLSSSGGMSSSSSSSYYKNVLRTNVTNEYALIHEIHEGKYDIVTDCGGGGGGGGGGNSINNVEKTTSRELRLPLLVGYVATIHCHDHSDWTALLVDEMHGADAAAAAAAAANTNSNNGRSSSSGKGVVCWIEEKLVKRHPNWVRPGCVWCIEGAKLALFASSSDTSCGDDDGGEIIDDVGNSKETSSSCTRNDANAVLDMSSSLGTNDISPSTESARGGGQIDRMILVGEYCMVYAWTPEEASSASFGHDEFINLMERRLGLGLPDKKMSSIELIDDGDDDGACILGRTDTTNHSAVAEEVGDTGSRNHNIDSSLNELEHTSNELESDLSSSIPVTAIDGSFAAATTKSIEPTEQCNDHVEASTSLSPLVNNVLSRPHGETASIPSPRHCDDGNDESKFCDKTIVTEELPAVQSTDCAEARCNEEKQMIENVGKSARDNVDLLRITPPRGVSSPTPTTTGAERNSGSCRPPDHGNANAPRPVSCETAASNICHNTINVNQNQQQRKNALSELKIIDSFDSDDALDDELLMMDTTSSAGVQAQSSCSTPKAPRKQLRIDTGDSFDYMLDEDDDSSFPGAMGSNDIAIHAVRNQQGLIKPTGNCPDDETKSPSNPTLPVLTRGASLFDSLDGDDLDFLNEDE